MKCLAKLDGSKSKTRMVSGFHNIPLDRDGQRIGGDGGNRTPVHDIETNSSTGVASLMIFSAAVFA